MSPDERTPAMGKAEIIDVTGTESSATVASLVPIHSTGSLVRAAAPMAEIETAFREYTALCDRLLDKDDYQKIGDKDFRKKSAWRKLAVAFGVSCRIVDRVYERNEHGRIVRAEVVVTATAPNGRQMDGLGAADLFEKCCPPGCGKGGRHKHCAPNCSGAVHFSNPQHDLPATAATRATNRACADLFGMGEVSAEEINADHPHHTQDDTPWWTAMGWPDEQSYRDAKRSLLERVTALDDAGKDAWKAWAAKEGTGFAADKAEWWTKTNHDRAVTYVAGLEAQVARAAAVSPPPPPAPPPAAEPPSNPVNETVARVKAMNIMDIDAALKERGISTAGNPELKRQRLTVSLLREEFGMEETHAHEAAGAMPEV